MYKLNKWNIRKVCLSTTAILGISIIAAFLVYLYCYPFGLSGPSRFEKARMEKMLYEIDKIVLTFNDSSNQQIIVDMNKFRELIPYAEFKDAIIVKGTRVPAIVTHKDGKNVNISMSTLYPVLHYDIDNSTFKGFGNAFEFTGDGAEKYLELIEELNVHY